MSFSGFGGGNSPFGPSPSERLKRARRERGGAVHEFHPDVVALLEKSGGKCQLMLCTLCGIRTVHTTPFFGYPFRCAANHGGTTGCDGCHTFVDFIDKVTVDEKGNCRHYCTLCSEPDSPQKQAAVAERRRVAAEEAAKPLDLNDPASIARALGASSFGKK